MCLPFVVVIVSFFFCVSCLLFCCFGIFFVCVLCFAPVLLFLPPYPSTKKHASGVLLMVDQSDIGPICSSGKPFLMFCLLLLPLFWTDQGGWVGGVD